MLFIQHNAKINVICCQHMKQPPAEKRKKGRKKKKNLEKKPQFLSNCIHISLNYKKS